MDKIDFYFKVLARYDQYVQLANTKASNHITLLASMLAATTALVGWGVTMEKLTFLTLIIGVLYIIFLYRCYEWYSSCMNVIEPNRMRKSDEGKSDEGKSVSEETTSVNEDELSSIFYSDVKKFSTFENFKTQVYKRDERQHLDDLIHQVSIMAKVTEKKFDDYQLVSVHVVHTVIFSVLILLVAVINKVGG